MPSPFPSPVVDRTRQGAWGSLVGGATVFSSHIQGVVQPNPRWCGGGFWCHGRSTPRELPLPHTVPFGSGAPPSACHPPFLHPLALRSPSPSYRSTGRLDPASGSGGEGVDGIGGPMIGLVGFFFFFYFFISFTEVGNKLPRKRSY